MTGTADERARRAAFDFASALAARWDQRLGSALLSVYLIGSLAHGGFSRRFSDIDVAVITETGLTPAELAAMRSDAATLSPDLAPKLSIFWSDRRFAGGRFPPLDLVDYLDHGLPLVDRHGVRPPRPDVDEVRAYLAGTPWTNWASSVGRFLVADVLRADDEKSYLRVLLYPARFVYSWSTGGIASNDHAVAFLSSHSPPGLDTELVMAALKCRVDAGDPQSLFGRRHALSRQRLACARLAGSGN